MIHGSKSVLIDPQAPWLLTTTKTLTVSAKDDPLCGPNFGTVNLGTSPVRWTSPAYSGPQSGAGDLFWNPFASGKARIAVDGAYAALRTALTSCVGNSMRKLYSSGPQAHGTLGASKADATFDPTDPSTADNCWAQRATNESMYGSLGPYRLPRPLPNPPGTADVDFIWKRGNNAAIKSRAGVVNWSKGANQSAAQAAADQTEFVSAIGRRLDFDAKALVNRYATSTIANRNGVEAAQAAPTLQTPNSYPMNLLNVSQASLADPSQQVFVQTQAGPQGLAPSGKLDAVRAANGVKSAYYDQSILTAGGGHPEYLEQMFYRSHLRELCQDPTIHTDLQTKCLSGAGMGGDPEACTACVYVAAARIRQCSELTSFDDPNELQKVSALSDSMCQTIGVEADRSGFPPQWDDLQTRRNGPDYAACGYPTWFLAFEWCTGTDLPGEGNPQVGGHNKDGSGGCGTRFVPTWDGTAVGTCQLTPDATTDLSKCSATTDSPPFIGYHSIRRASIVSSYQFEAAIAAESILGVNSGATLDPVAVAAWEAAQVPSPGPIVNAFNDIEHFDEIVPANQATDSLPVGCVQYQYDDLWDARLTRFAISPLPVFDPTSPGILSLVSDPLVNLETPFCGMSQRVSVWNSSCDSALAKLRIVPSTSQGKYDAQTGFQYQEQGLPSGSLEVRCSIREPVRVSGICPDNMFCTSGGVCVASPIVATPAINALEVVSQVTPAPSSSASLLTCPPCPAPQAPTVDTVPPAVPQFPCAGSNWSYYLEYQDPVSCQCSSQKMLGGCCGGTSTQPGAPSIPPCLGGVPRPEWIRCDTMIEATPGRWADAIYRGKGYARGSGSAFVAITSRPACRSNPGGDFTKVRWTSAIFAPGVQPSASRAALRFSRCCRRACSQTSES